MTRDRTSHRGWQAAPVGSLPRRPSGFTLTELLVVLVIIGILSSLMLAGLAVARAGARAGKTSTTIRKLNEVLLPAYEEYEVRRPVLPDVSGLAPAQYQNLQRIAIRRLMTLEIPDNQADIPRPEELESVGGQPFPIAVNGRSLQLREMPPVARRYSQIIAHAEEQYDPTSANPAGKPFGADSAELLYMIVMRGPASDPDLVAHFRPDEMGDVDNDGLPEFLDAWGRPIRFRRWPVGIASPLQPADGEPDLLVSTSGYPLFPLIYSAGSNGDYDLEAGLPGPPSAGYAANQYDPFFGSPGPPTSLSAIAADDITNHDLIR